MSFGTPPENPPNSTAVCIDVPQEMTPEQQRDFAQRMSRAAREMGFDGAQAIWVQSYGDRHGDPVFYIP